MGNHRLLTTSTKLGSARIKGFKMFSLGGFPYVSPTDDPEFEITIEVYEVDQTTMRRLDSLEGYPSFYDRQLVQTPFGEAWIYFIASYRSAPPVLHGDWVRYKTEAA